MQNLETANEKAKEGQIGKAINSISKDLVRVYQQIADEYLTEVKAIQPANAHGMDENEQKRAEYFELAERFYSKCLDVSRQQGFNDKVAECHQSLGLIHEMKGNLDQAIEERKKFLEITKDNNDLPAQVQAYKQLAETYSKDKKIVPAIDNLRDMLSIAVETSDNNAKSEAALKLGLLFYKPGPR